MTRPIPHLLAVLVLSALPVSVAQAATPTPAPSEPSVTRPTPTKPRPTFRYTPPDSEGDRKRAAARAGAYLDTVAAGLGEPGVWIDPAVDRLTASDRA